MSAGGGYEAAVTARTICGRVTFMGCDELLHARFSLKLKEVVYRSSVRPAMLYRSEGLCLKNCEMVVL